MSLRSPVLRPFRDDPVVVMTDLGIQECEARLRSLLVSRGFLWRKSPGGGGADMIGGRVRNGIARLYIPRWWHNSYMPVLTVRLLSNGGGTVLQGTVGLHPLAKWGSLVWFVLAASSVIGVAIGEFGKRGSDTEWWVPLFVIAFPCAVWPVAWLGRFVFGGHDDDRIVNAVAEVVEGTIEVWS